MKWLIKLCQDVHCHQEEGECMCAPGNIRYLMGQLHPEFWKHGLSSIYVVSNKKYWMERVYNPLLFNIVIPGLKGPWFSHKLSTPVHIIFNTIWKGLVVKINSFILALYVSSCNISKRHGFHMVAVLFKAVGSEWWCDNDPCFNSLRSRDLSRLRYENTYEIIHYGT
jgi:hypothetical protein